MKRVFFFLALFISSIQVFSQDALTLSNINLRESASSSTQSLLLIPKGAAINIQRCNNGWCKVNYQNRSGYIRSRLVTYKNESLNENTTNYNRVHKQIKYYTNSAVERVQSPTFYDHAPQGSSAICRDGTYSFSRNRRGTCSHHGGVKKWL